MLALITGSNASPMTGNIPKYELNQHIYDNLSLHCAASPDLLGFGVNAK